MRPQAFLIAFLSTLVISLGLWAVAHPSFSQKGEGFSFALIGDLPYDNDQIEKFGNLTDQINQSDSRFVVHDGDFKSGTDLCSDEVFAQRKQLFDRFELPLIYVPGDNEWTDCYRESNGSYDPLERLEKFRDLFTQGNQSLGKRTLSLSRQSENSRFAKFRENVRWSYGDVLFVGLNVTGSNNGFGRTPEGDAEYRERNIANLAWMQEAFTLAKQNGDRGIMLIIQANPNFELEPAERTGFNDFLGALETETFNFRGQVVLVHGDSHYFRIDKPLLHFTHEGIPPLENFTRVETFGSPNVHWLRATVNASNPNLFEFEQMIVDANRSRSSI
ncbi:metallophosphoesterase [Oculatella sp. FACHB-28]|uniref:metallophosphoesterase family protein n=1 Tax=Oculatella sp. FACHB-28 TaxID=2692845 RepID=UPI00168603F4|nr:metallophosphoesterase [Oculatella sp. FACHB-28]MBD2058957.1 metallophosphoesterase [Oculatella sp. FACHB-28]